MQLKDYYKTLGVPPSATQQEIKKAYRALAFKYHPDKNPENSLSEAYFKEVQEAYATLSHNNKRIAYDDERWLSGMGGKTHYNEAVTPAWLITVSHELNISLATMDTHRMSQRALQAYILLILSDAHIGVLQQHADQKTNHAIIKGLLKASKKLEVKYLDEIEHRLIILANGDSAILESIDAIMEARIREARREKLLPYFILLITLALCILMYLYGA